MKKLQELGDSRDNFNKLTLEGHMDLVIKLLLEAVEKHAPGKERKKPINPGLKRIELNSVHRH